MTSIEILKLNRNNYYLATEIEEKKTKKYVDDMFHFFFKSDMMVVKYPGALSPTIFYVGGAVVTSVVDGLVDYMSLGDKIKTQELFFSLKNSLNCFYIT